MNQVVVEARHVCRATGLSPGALRRLIDLGHVSVPDRCPGKGCRRRFRTTDVAVLAVIAKLASLGVAMGDAARLAQLVTAEVVEGLGQGDRLFLNVGTRDGKPHARIEPSPNRTAAATVVDLSTVVLSALGSAGAH